MVDPYYIKSRRSPTSTLRYNTYINQMKAYVYDDLPSVPTLTLAIPG